MFLNKIIWQTLILIYVFVFSILQIQISAGHTEEGLELIFRQRSQSDWRDVWHQETHSRCRDKLVRHLYWACEKDIYSMTRRNNKRTNDNKNNSNNYSYNDESVKRRIKASIWFLDDNSWPRFLRTRRSPSLSITDECCTRIGCTWEEYAEYCPSNKRKNHY